MYMSCGILESVHYRNPISEASGNFMGFMGFSVSFFVPTTRLAQEVNLMQNCWSDLPTCQYV